MGPAQARHRRLGIRTPAGSGGPGPSANQSGGINNSRASAAAAAAPPAAPPPPSAGCLVIVWGACGDRAARVHTVDNPGSVHRRAPLLTTTVGRE